MCNPKMYRKMFMLIAGNNSSPTLYDIEIGMMNDKIKDAGV